MFGPVPGEIFDLIVSNPPFIISPDNRHFFLNSGMDSDDVCRRIVTELPKFLNEGGYCIFNAIGLSSREKISTRGWRVGSKGSDATAL